MDIKKYIKKFNPIVDDHIAFDSFFSVNVTDKNSDINFWVDVEVKDKDLSIDWNQYIFHTNNEWDMLKKSMQENDYIFDICSSLAVTHLERMKMIKQGEKREWFDIFHKS